MTKKERAEIYAKYGGHCAYCGCELPKVWHVDHVKPVKRKHAWDRKSGRFKATGEFKRPKNDCLENCMPACPSCNINKHAMSLEDFRKLVAGFITSLNRDSTQYKIAKRYGMIEERVKPVIFYFETYVPLQADVPVMGGGA